MDAYLAGGCFWCMEKPYGDVSGVTFVESGYCGGVEEAPTYEQVKAQKTDHRETVHIVFDPEIISFEKLLKVYFYNIDPFDGGGQFIDRGRSYTCAVYYTDDMQKSVAEDCISRIEKKYGKKVCVSLEKYEKFRRAEEYHQHYAEKNADEYAEEYRISGRADIAESDRVKL